MADKSRFGPELSEAKIDAPVQLMLMLEFLTTSALSTLIITTSALRAPLVIYHFIFNAPP